MKNSYKAIMLASVLAFSTGAMAQSGGAGGSGGGSGNPTENLGMRSSDPQTGNLGKDSNTTGHTGANKAHKKSHSSSSGSSDYGSGSTGSSVAPNMQRTPDGVTPTPDATLPAAK